MEYHDELPVTAYEARFQGRKELPQLYGEKLYKGHVAVFLVAGMVDHRKAEYVARKDFEDEKTRRYVLDIEDMVPLEGQLKDQAILYLAYGGEVAVDFGTPTQAEVAIDRLHQYIEKSWPAGLPAADELNAESLVLAAIEQLENYLAGVTPRPTVIEESPTPNLDELAAGAVKDHGKVTDLMEALEESVAKAKEARLRQPAAGDNPELAESNSFEEAEDAQGVQPDTAEAPRPEREVQAGDDGVAVGSTPEAGEAPPRAVDVARLKAMMAEADEPVDRGGLKVGKVDEPADGVDADGYPITVMDEVEVVGSVYPPGHSGANQRVIEGAFSR